MGKISQKTYLVCLLVGLIVLCVESLPTIQEGQSANFVQTHNGVTFESKTVNSVGRRKPKTLNTIFNMLGSMSLIPGLSSLLSMNADGGTRFQFVPLGRLLYNSYSGSSRQNSKSSTN